MPLFILRISDSTHVIIDFYSLGGAIGCLSTPYSEARSFELTVEWQVVVSRFIDRLCQDHAIKLINEQVKGAQILAVGWGQVVWTSNVGKIHLQEHSCSNCCLVQPARSLIDQRSMTKATREENWHLDEYAGHSVFVSTKSASECDNGHWKE